MTFALSHASHTCTQRAGKLDKKKAGINSREIELLDNEKRLGLPGRAAAETNVLRGVTVTEGGHGFEWWMLSVVKWKPGQPCQKGPLLSAKWRTASVENRLAGRGPRSPSL